MSAYNPFRTFGLTVSLLCALSAPAAVLERLEASVNHQVVLKSDLHQFRNTLPLRAQLDPLFSGTPLALEGSKASDAAILEFLVDEKIILQQFPLTDAEVDQEINSIQANNQITREQLKAAIQAQGFSFQDYYELIRVGAAKRNLIDREIRTKVTVSDDDVRNHYYSNYARGQTALQSYQLEMITQKDRKKIEAAYQQFKSGAPFSEVAKKFSDDSSAENGGDLGFTPEDQFNKPLRAEIKRLGIGQVSGILGNAKTRYFFFRVIASRPAEDQKLKQVSEQIRAHLASGEYQRQLQLWLERQRQVAFIRKAGDASIAGLPKGP